MTTATARPAAAQHTKSRDFWAGAPPELRRLASELMADIQRSGIEIESKRAAADPAANKLSRVMDNTAYRYWNGGKDGRGRSIRFCWSSHRNVAGYFLGWREVISKKQVKRDRWYARKSRTRCKEIAAARRDVALAKAAA